ncbi:MAG TPA: phosphoribosyltransferase, partial [Nitrosopumilaceae archaeon]|nr:phosphoribosyltransferase [Nitrosopumilaceae archaeon]
TKTPTSFILFSDRTDAGKQLAKKLEFVRKENPIILAIPRGGIVVADIVASALGCKLDIIVSRKIGAPHNPELAIGAVLHDGSYFPNSDVVKMLQVPQRHIDLEIAEQMKEIHRRLISYRGSIHYDLKGKTVILVDDGLATGATMIIAVLWVKKQRPKNIIVAVPVGSRETVQKLAQIVDEVVVLAIPGFFNAVGQFYENFDQIEDIEVQKIMRKYGYNI